MLQRLLLLLAGWPRWGDPAGCCNAFVCRRSALHGWLLLGKTAGPEYQQAVARSGRLERQLICSRGFCYYTGNRRWAPVDVHPFVTLWT